MQCLQCLEELQTKDSKKFCSRSCAAKYNNARREVNPEWHAHLKRETKCIECKANILDTYTNKKYCSDLCRKKHIIENNLKNRKKSIEGVYPYENYFYYLLNFNKNNLRKKVNLVSKDGMTKLSMLYSRYLMSVKEGRVLEEFEHVDHINNDPLDDRIENLQILSLAQNNKKYQSEVLKGRLMVELICPCGTQFSKERRNTHILESNGAKNTYCSRRCSSTFGKSLKETKTILVREFREFE